MPPYETRKRIEIFTGQMGKRHAAAKIGLPVLDITAMSGNTVFAPDWKILKQYKQGLVSNGRYTDVYREKMYASMESHPEEWEKLAGYKRVLALCYCAPGKYCHRHVWLDVVQEYFMQGYCPEHLARDVVNMGEFLGPESVPKP